MEEFCGLEGEGPIELKPLITSLKDFYRGVFELHQSKNLFSTDSIGVRKELFKLNYMS